MKRFNILFDDESLLYFPGSFLTGKVLLELEDNTPATGLHLHVVGEGVVRFGSDKRRGSKTIASDRENYIDFRMRLLGDGPLVSSDKTDTESVAAAGRQRDAAPSIGELSSSSSDDDDGGQSCETDKGKVLVLSPGVHTFPFKLGLPPNLPSTFLGLHGWVQYFCRAVLKEPSGLVHKNQQVFIIINPIDLNNEPTNLQQPFYCEAEEKINASKCASSGLISCKVRLDRGAFVPGENIIVSASIENSSKFSIKRTRAVLAETIEYRAKNKIIQTETRELASIERGKIGPRSTDVWKKESLHIPALPPTNLRGCQLIKIHYDVYVSTHTQSVVESTHFLGHQQKTSAHLLTKLIPHFDLCEQSACCSTCAVSNLYQGFQGANQAATTNCNGHISCSQQRWHLKTTQGRLVSRQPANI